MFEGAPTNFNPEETGPNPEENITPKENIPRQHESEREIFEKIFSDAKVLKEQGIDPFENEDYTESSNPAVVSLWDRVLDWEARHGLTKLGIRTPEKANNMVRAAMLWIDAGYTDKKIIQEALDRLVIEEQDAEKNQANPEVQEILSKAVDKLEGMLSENKPEKGISAEIEKAMLEAQEKIAKGDFMDTVRLLTSTLLTARYKKFFKKNPERKDIMTKLRDSAREKWKNQG